MFEIYNAESKLQFQAVKPHLVLATSGVATTIANTGTNKRYQNGTSWVTIGYSGIRPLIAVRPPNGMAYMGQSAAPSGGNLSWTFAGSMPGGVSMPYWVFDIPTTFPNETGISTYGPAGEQLWHSSQKVLRVAPNGRKNVSSAGPAGAGAYAGTAGRLYAAIFGSYIGGWQWVPGARDPETGIISAGFYRRSGYGIAVSEATDGLNFPRYTHSGANTDNGVLFEDTTDPIFWPGQIIVTDVTNY